MTKQIWEQSKEEFGERAFERFLIKFKNQLLPVQDNKTAEMSLDILELKPLQELFAHDVEVYGENAFLMWEVRLKINDSVITVKRNSQIKTILNDCLNNYSCLRRTSAELPFDLQPAKNGDVVEFMSILPAEWVVVDSIEVSNRADYGHIVTVNGITKTCYDESHLRMKYPQKVAK